MKAVCRKRSGKIIISTVEAHYISHIYIYPFQGR